MITIFERRIEILYNWKQLFLFKETYAISWDGCWTKNLMEMILTLLYENEKLMSTKPMLLQSVEYFLLWNSFGNHWVQHTLDRKSYLVEVRWCYPHNPRPLTVGRQYDMKSLVVGVTRWLDGVEGLCGIEEGCVQEGLWFVLLDVLPTYAEKMIFEDNFDLLWFLYLDTCGFHVSWYDSLQCKLSFWEIFLLGFSYTFMSLRLGNLLL